MEGITKSRINCYTLSLDCTLMRIHAKNILCIQVRVIQNFTCSADAGCYIVHEATETKAGVLPSTVWSVLGLIQSIHVHRNFFFALTWHHTSRVVTCVSFFALPI